MRIVGGNLKGRALAGPSGAGLRPTSERTREAVFNILQHGIADFSLSGARVLDLFAGTGALGLEALSRGSRYCLFVESDAGARALIRRNVEALSLTGATRVYRRDAARLGPAEGMKPFTLVFADPPYGEGLGVQAAHSALAGGWIEPGALLVLEERAGTPIDLGERFEVIDQRRYGETVIVFARAAG